MCRSFNSGMSSSSLVYISCLLGLSEVKRPRGYSGSLYLADPHLFALNIAGILALGNTFIKFQYYAIFIFYFLFFDGEEQY